MVDQPQSWLSTNIKSILAIIIVLSAVSYLFMVTITTQDATVKSQAETAMIMLISGVTGYYFGYSQGAAKKDDAQAALTANSSVQTTTTTKAPITPPQQ